MNQKTRWEPTVSNIPVKARPDRWAPEPRVNMLSSTSRLRHIHFRENATRTRSIDHSRLPDIVTMVSQRLLPSLYRGGEIETEVKEEGVEGRGCNLWRGSLNRDSGRPSPIPPVKRYEGGKEGQRPPGEYHPGPAGPAGKLSLESVAVTQQWKTSEPVTRPIKGAGTAKPFVAPHL